MVYTHQQIKKLVAPIVKKFDFSSVEGVNRTGGVVWLYENGAYTPSDI